MEQSGSEITAYIMRLRMGNNLIVVRKVYPECDIVKVTVRKGMVI